MECTRIILARNYKPDAELIQRLPYADDLVFCTSRPNSLLENESYWSKNPSKKVYAELLLFFFVSRQNK